MDIHNPKQLHLRKPTRVAEKSAIKWKRWTVKARKGRFKRAKNESK